MSSNKIVQSVDRAMRILKCFSEETPELKLSEISDHLDLNKSTVHGIVSTLKAHGLLEQNEENQKYKLGLKLMELGDVVAHSIDILKIAPPLLTELGKILNETIHIGILDGMEVSYIYKQESSQSMRIHTTIGARNPAHCTGLGKVLLAYVDPEILDEIMPEILERRTPNTIVDREKLYMELDAIRKKGYALDHEEIAEGLTCVATPLFDQNGSVKYAMSTSGPTFRMTEEKIDETIQNMKEVAKTLSLKLGYKGL